MPPNRTPDAGRSQIGRTARARWPLVLATVVAGTALGAVLYGRTPLAPKGEAGACTRSTALARKAAPLQQGEVAAMNTPATIAPMPALSFQGPDGKGKTLADFRGRTVLLNLWATWCVPCRQEMPALDRLQAKAGSQDFEVLTINIDTSRLERPKAFLNEIGVKTLAYYSDPKADVFYQLKQAGKVVGLPTTFLVGPDGCEIATLAGPAEWSGDDALALVQGVVDAKNDAPAAKSRL